jgi:hypothetical protein|tara:strand:+ start:262 stop:675 length:414 start_codon:yes stop_codon:yes gene_type:complete
MAAKPKITEDVQFQIERMVRLWEGKLTWNSLTQRIEIELGMKVTRQTLEDYKGIYAAYKQKKELLRGIDPKSEKMITKNDIHLSERLKRLEAEIEVKDKIINEQKKFLQRILQNAADIPSLKGNINFLIPERPEDKI